MNKAGVFPVSRLTHSRNSQFGLETINTKWPFYNANLDLSYIATYCLIAEDVKYSGRLEHFSHFSSNELSKTSKKSRKKVREGARKNSNTGAIPNELSLIGSA